jgi:hypothetical protein
MINKIVKLMWAISIVLTIMIFFGLYEYHTKKPNVEIKDTIRIDSSKIDSLLNG